MNRAQAADRIEKLEELADPSRGGTPAECATASQKARVLRERFGIRQARVPRPKRRARRTFVADSLGETDWFFNLYTGHASPNVSVHHHTSPSNWKIEINPRIGEPLIKGKRRRRLDG